MHSPAVADDGGGAGASNATTTVYTSCLWLLDSMCDQEEPSPLRQPLKSLAAAAAEATASGRGSSMAGSAAGSPAPACSDGAHLIAHGGSQEIQAWSSWQAATKMPAAAPQPGSPLITSKLHPASSAPSHLPSQPQQGQRLRAPGQGLGQLRGISAQLRRLSEQLPQVLEAASQRISAHVAAGSGAPLAAAAELQQAPPPAGKLQGFGSRLRRFSERLPQVLEAGSQRIGARMGSSTSAGVEVEVEQASGLQRLGARLRRYSEQMLMPAAAAAEAPGESGQPAGTELRELRGHRPAGHAAAPAPAAASGRVVDIHVYAGCVANLQQPAGPQETGNTCASASFVQPLSTAASQAQYTQGLPGLSSSEGRQSYGHLLPPATVLGAGGSSSSSMAGPQPAALPAGATTAQAAGMPSRSVADQEAAAPEASESAEVLELVVESSGEVEGGSSLQAITSVEHYAYVSPAHLIAPAPPALPCTPVADLTPQVAPATIASTISPAASTISTASDDSEALCEVASPPPPALELQPEEEQQQQSEEEVQAAPVVQREMPASQPEAPVVQQAVPALQQAVPAPLPEHSWLSSLSASSGGYSSLEAAGGPWQAAASPARSCSGSPEEAATAGTTSWQRAREEGHVRRSLAHPIFGLQPQRGTQEQAERQQQQQQQQGEGRPPNLAGLKALAAAQRRWSPSDSPVSSPTSGKAWTLSASHIQVDLAAAAGAAAGAAPPTHRTGPQLLAAIEQWQRQQAASAIGAAATGQYASMLQQTEQLNLSRARRAVRASLKVEKRAEAAAAATAATPARSFFGRVVARCLRRADGPRKLRRALKRQRVHLLCLGRVPYNPDEPLHFQLWQAVCRAFAGWDASASLKRDPTLAAWQVLGFSAANPAAELADTGLLCLLLLLLLADRTPQLAAEVLAASAAALNGAPLAAAAVATTGWTLRLLRSGELAAEAQRLESTCTAAEFFFLSCMDSFLQELRQASPQVLRLPPGRALMALLALAEERACGDVHAAVARGQELAG